jgi:osmotically inducible lipoprotein OsmB
MEICNSSCEHGFDTSINMISIVKEGIKLAHRLACVALIGFFLAGCSLTNREERAVTGGAVGAAGGAAIGALSGGSVLTGALVGGAGGAAIGALTGNDEPRHKHRSKHKHKHHDD